LVEGLPLFASGVELEPSNRSTAWGRSSGSWPGNPPKKSHPNGSGDDPSLKISRDEDGFSDDFFGGLTEKFTRLANRLRTGE